MASKPLRWLGDVQIRTPPFSEQARFDVGAMLREVQDGISLGLPHSKPLPDIGKRVHELRVHDPRGGKHWRVIYRIDPQEIVIVHAYDKQTERMPTAVASLCKKRLSQYDRSK